MASTYLVLRIDRNDFVALFPVNRASLQNQADCTLLRNNELFLFALDITFDHAMLSAPVKTFTCTVKKTIVTCMQLGAKSKTTKSLDDTVCYTCNPRNATISCLKLTATFKSLIIARRYSSLFQEPFETYQTLNIF